MIRLSDQELEDLTAYKQPSKQIAWLKRHGVRFMVAANGHPRVLRKEVENTENSQARTPNFEALKKLG